MRILVVSLALVFLVGCQSQAPRGWFFLRWVEVPLSDVAKHKLPAEEEQTKFDLVGTYIRGKDDFEAIKGELREGDLIAYHMTLTESAVKIATGKLNTIGYQLLDYGHLAILVHKEETEDLVLFSSQSFKGPNIREGADTLADHSFDIYRLDQWDRVDKKRIYEFVDQAQKKAGNFYGYDFSGMFGLWNSNLKPASPEEIGYNYICSTVVLACLYYAGVELEAARWNGFLDLVSPRQVVVSRGRIVTPPQVEIKIETEIETETEI